MEIESLCDDNVRIYRNFLSKDESEFITKWFQEFNYSGLPEHKFRFWGQRLMTPSITTGYPGFENSFSEIMDLNNQLQLRLKDALNMVEVAPWQPSPFNYIKMWKDSNPIKEEMKSELEMFYHVDNQDHMVQTIFWGMVIYPNDDYEGGEIEYPQYKFKYKPEAGSMVMHEGYTRHGVRKVKSGDRFCMASLTTKEGVWNPSPKPTPTNRPENPWHYPPGYNGFRMPSDLEKGIVSIPRPDGSLAPFTFKPKASAGDTTDGSHAPGDTKLIK
jgi:hypothetical protein